MSRPSPGRRALVDHLRSFSSLAIAFSGGVDSSLLLAAAQEALGDRVLAVTGVSPSLSSHQRDQAQEVAAFLDVTHRELKTDELSDADYVANRGDRCYFCKRELHGRLRSILGEEWPHIADGTNADDLHGHRPGHRAAREAQIMSPLAKMGLGKEQIRALSREYGLPTSDVPASPCLASRIPNGHIVSEEGLRAVERGEEALRNEGLVEFRLRHFGERARLEIAKAELEHLSAADEKRLRQAVLADEAFLELDIDPRPLKSGRLSDQGAQPS